jgi:bisphosphoglycerate-dependent phosphoglycerate mutase
MVRHGESEWNKLNQFCGWYDAELSDQGSIVWISAKGRVCMRLSGVDLFQPVHLLGGS